MKIISKRRAMTIYRQHPESRNFRYCSGKYQWHGSVCHYTRQGWCRISTGVLAVNAERRQDRQRALYPADEHHPELTIKESRAMTHINWACSGLSPPRLGARLVQEGNRLHYLADRASITGRFQ